MIRILGGVWVEDRERKIKGGELITLRDELVTAREAFQLYKKLKRKKGRYLKQLEFNFNKK